MNTSTEQVGQTRDEKGRITGGKPPVGFHTNPERINASGWRKSDTPRYKLEQMMKLGDAELQDVIDEPQTPTFERKIAQAIQQGQWREIKEMIEQVYGKAKESMELSNPDGNLAPTVRIIDERPSSSSSTQQKA